MQTSSRAALGAVALAVAVALVTAPPALGAAPTAADVTDNFNRSTLGANWAPGSLPDAPGSPVIASSARVAFPPAGVSSAHWAPRQFGTGQQATLVKRSGGLAGVTACVRTPGAGASGYALTGNGSGALTLKRYTGGAVTTLYSDYAGGGTFVTHDTLGIVVTATGVEAWLKKSGSSTWSLARSVTDSAAAGCSGSIGIIGQAPSGDDFIGGAVAPTTPTLPQVPVQRGDAFVDGLGINTHFNWLTTPYCTAQTALISRLVELGIKHVRESAETYARMAAAGTACPSALTTLKNLYDDHQVRTQFVAHTILEKKTTAAQAIAALDATGADNDLIEVAQELRAAGALSAFEATNEPDGKDKTVNTNIFYPANWSSYTFPWRGKLREFMAAFSQRSLNRLPGVDRVFSGLAYGPPQTYAPRSSYRAYAQLGDLTSTFDVGNMHPYTYGYVGAPEPYVGQWFDEARMISRTKPLQATEIGFFDSTANTSIRVSPRAASLYLPRHVLEMAARGAQRTFIYELADGKLAEANKYSFGLVDRNGAPKPAFHAMRRLITHLRDSGTSGTAPSAAALSVSGPGIRSHVVGHRNGDLIVALWQPGVVWDTVNRVDVEPAPVPATIAVGRTYGVQTLAVTGAAFSGAPEWAGTGQATTTAPASVSVGGGPTLVRLTPR